MDSGPRFSRQFCDTVAYLAERTPGCPGDVTPREFLAKFASAWRLHSFEQDEHSKTNCPCGSAIELRCNLRHTETGERVYIGNECFEHLHPHAADLVAIQRSLFRGLVGELVAAHGHYLYFEMAAKNMEKTILYKRDPGVVAYFGASPLHERLLKVRSDKKRTSRGLVVGHRYGLILRMCAHSGGAAAVYEFVSLKDDKSAVANNQDYKPDSQAMRRAEEADKPFEDGVFESSDEYSGESEPTASDEEEEPEEEEEEEEEADDGYFDDDCEDDEELPPSEGDSDIGITTAPSGMAREPRYKRRRGAVTSFRDYEWDFSV